MQIAQTNSRQTIFRILFLDSFMMWNLNVSLSRILHTMVDMANTSRDAFQSQQKEVHARV